MNTYKQLAERIDELLDLNTKVDGIEYGTVDRNGMRVYDLAMVLRALQGIFLKGYFNCRVVFTTEEGVVRLIDHESRTYSWDLTKPLSEQSPGLHSWLLELLTPKK